MPTEPDNKCPRCGTPLRLITVRRPIYKTSSCGRKESDEVSHYETDTEQSECVRCTGSY